MIEKSKILKKKHMETINDFKVKGEDLRHKVIYGR